MGKYTSQQIVDQIDKAIFEIVSKQLESTSVDFGGGKIQSFTALDLDKLRALRREFKSEIAQDENGDFVAASFSKYGRFQ